MLIQSGAFLAELLVDIPQVIFLIFQTLAKNVASKLYEKQQNTMLIME